MANILSEMMKRRLSRPETGMAAAGAIGAMVARQRAREARERQAMEEERGRAEREDAASRQRTQNPAPEGRFVRGGRRVF